MDNILVGILEERIQGHGSKDTVSLPGEFAISQLLTKVDDEWTILYIFGYQLELWETRGAFLQ